MRLLLNITMFYVFFGWMGEVHANQDGISLNCSPQDTMCYFYFEDNSIIEVTREQLPHMVPMAKDTSDCWLELCYGDDGNVIGLNPDYHLWREPNAGYVQQ